MVQVTNPFGLELLSGPASLAGRSSGCADSPRPSGPPPLLLSVLRGGMFAHPKGTVLPSLPSVFQPASG